GRGGRGQPRVPGDLRRLVLPWCSAALLLAAGIGVALIPNIGLRPLLLRLMLPLSALPAVTTTKIIVEPGEASILRGQQVNILARIANLTRGGVESATASE